MEMKGGPSGVQGRAAARAVVIMGIFSGESQEGRRVWPQSPQRAGWASCPRPLPASPALLVGVPRVGVWGGRVSAPLLHVDL